MNNNLLESTESKLNLQLKYGLEKRREDFTNTNNNNINFNIKKLFSIQNIIIICLIILIIYKINKNNK